MKIVKSFGAREFEESKFEKKALSVAQLTYVATRLLASQGSLMTFIFTTATGAILLFGGREIVAGRLSSGALAAFIFYMALLAMPVRMTGWLINTVTRAASAGQRIFDVLDAESPVQEKQGARPLPRIQGAVRFERRLPQIRFGGAGPAQHPLRGQARPNGRPPRRPRLRKEQRRPSDTPFLRR